MRRSTKAAIASAFGIAVIAAQVSSSDTGVVERYKTRLHRADRILTLREKFATVSDLNSDLFYQLLERVNGLRALYGFSGNH
jgi:hypothetical protein